MDIQTVKKVATLARLEMNESELEAVRVKLGNIMKFVEQLGEVNTDNVEPLANVVDRVAKSLGPGPHPDFNIFMDAVEADASEHGVKLTAKRKKLLQNELAQRNETAKPVVKKVHKHGKATPDPIRGRFPSPEGDPGLVVEYEPDSELRDTEQIPLLEPGGIDAFIRREVLPHAPDAWIDDSKTEIGYEISFNRYFYAPQPLRTLEEIRKDIITLASETEGLLAKVIGH